MAASTINSPSACNTTKRRAATWPKRCSKLLAGTSVSRPEHVGDRLSHRRVRKIEPHGDITYTKHVASIFNRSCVECHRQGELAPFPLTTYDEIVGWADTIREVIQEGRMPPGSRIPRSDNSPTTAA